MKYDIVTIGSAVRDVFVETDRFRIIETGAFEEGRAECLPAGAKIEIDEMVFTTGGGATNAAVTFARQGFSVAPVVRVGKDMQAEEIRKELESEGVLTDLFQIDPKKKTGYSTLLLASDGERTALVMRGASSAINFDEIPLDKIKTKWFYLTSLGGDMDLLEKITVFAEERDIKVFLNPGSRELEDSSRLLATLEHIDVLNLNLEEAARLVAIDRTKKEEVFHALWGATKGIVVVTDGPNGVDAYDGEHIHHAGIFENENENENENVVDRTGAGDAFGSGFVVGLMRSESVKEGIRVGTANATSVIEYVGAKEGILRSDKLSDQRWGDLEITEEQL